ncbi:MAG: YbjN domain-containing protein [Actinomycetaceae bacterium]|nr:YbjN domain-containing protein [Actinomycetaceae bacterium]
MTLFDDAQRHLRKLFGKDDAARSRDDLKRADAARPDTAAGSNSGGSQAPSNERNHASDVPAEGAETSEASAADDAHADGTQAPATPARAPRESSATPRAGDEDGADDLPRFESDTSEFHKPLTITIIEDLVRLSPFPVIGSTLEDVTVLIHELPLTISLSEGGLWLLIRTAIELPEQETPFPQRDEELNPKQLDDQLHLLIDATNAWNREHFQPTAYVDRAEDNWVLRLDCAYFAGAGLSTDQFAIALARSVAYCEQASEQIPALIPPI